MVVAVVVVARWHDLGRAVGVGADCRSAARPATATERAGRAGLSPCRAAGTRRGGRPHRRHHRRPRSWCCQHHQNQWQQSQRRLQQSRSEECRRQHDESGTAITPPNPWLPRGRPSLGVAVFGTVDPRTDVPLSIDTKRGCLRTCSAGGCGQVHDPGLGAPDHVRRLHHLAGPDRRVAVLPLPAGRPLGRRRPPLNPGLQSLPQNLSLLVLRLISS